MGLELPSHLQEQLLQLNKRIKKLIEKSSYSPNLMQEASLYSLEMGKKLRPLLVFSFAEAFAVPLDKLIDPACALEMVHTFSLIHDDLPCMDDDDFRRGKPTLHKVYGEAIALLTGDFLVTYAFEVLSKAPNLTEKQRIQLIQTVSKYSGNQGIIAGQTLDLLSTGKVIPSKKLIKMHYYKTASLLQCALEMAATLASLSFLEFTMVHKLGCYLGIAYQITDDILDVTSSLEALGKDTFSDAKKQKPTAVSLWGLQEAKGTLDRLHKAIFLLVEKLKLQDTSVKKIIDQILVRDY